MHAAKKKQKSLFTNKINDYEYNCVLSTEDSNKIHYCKHNKNLKKTLYLFHLSYEVTYTTIYYDVITHTVSK